MYLDILKDIETFFNNHSQVSEYEFGNISDLSTIERKFPLIFLQSEESSIKEYEIEYNFDIYSFTLYEQDTENLINGLNDTQLILKDFIAYFKHNVEEDYWLNIDSLNLEVLTGAFDNYLIGWQLSFKFISVLDYDSCNLPIDNRLLTEEIVVIDNVGLIVSEGTSLTKLGEQGWNEGCASQQQINSGEGWVEFKIRVVNSILWQVVLGLSHTNLDAGPVNINFGLYISNTGLYKIENGLSTFISAYTPADGDLFRVRVDDSIVTYEKYNGLNWDIIDISSTTPTYPLLFDCCFNADGTGNQNHLTIENIKISAYDLI